MTSMVLPVVLLFGLSCPDPCPISANQIATLERDVQKVLAGKGFDVRPPPADVLRPTSPEAPPDPQDVAQQLGVDRVLVLDYDASDARVWVTQYVRGTVGVWAIERMRCEPPKTKRDPFCAHIAGVILKTLRHRRAKDVDVIAFLRARATSVERCLKREKRVPLAERYLGKIEMDLVVHSDGAVKVHAIAPAAVSARPLGDCLRSSMEKTNLGPFEGEPIEFRVPIDVD